MGKLFTEYKSENGKVPYSASTICFCLAQYAKDYVAQQGDDVDLTDMCVRDAVLVDSINYIGFAGLIDFALYTSDLYDDEELDEYVDPQILLTIVQNYYATYVYNQDMVDSVMRNGHMNECKGKFDENDGINVLVDFMNYIANKNDFDVQFTADDLYDKYKRQTLSRELKELKAALEGADEYSERLSNGEDVDKVLEDLVEEYNLSGSLDDDVYAMAYAESKHQDGELPLVKNEVINRHVLEIKKG